MKKENMFLLGFIGLLLIFGIVFLISSLTTSKQEIILNYNTSIKTTKSSDINLSILDREYINNDYIKGDINAPITIVEFSDYQCPFCVKFYKDTYKDIEKNYILSGKVKFVYRDFPLPNHQYAEGAAIAAECAGLQNKYYMMYTLLFDYGVSANKERYIEYAKTLDLNINSFEECINSNITYSEIKEDYSDALNNFGINSTPSFFINGERIVGAQPYSVFSQVIEKKLNEINNQ